MQVGEDKVKRPEDWAGTPLMRYFHYLKRRRSGGMSLRPETVDSVTKLTKELERLASKEEPDPKQIARTVEVRRVLCIDGTS